MLWPLILVLSLGVTAALIWPLVRPRAAAGARVVYDIEVYRDQLREIDRDLASGVLGEGDAGAARTEVERRMLVALQSAPTPPPATALPPRPSLAAAAVVAAVLPLFAVGVYAWRGSPQVPDQPFATRAPGGEALAGDRAAGPPPADMETALSRLRERLAREPGNVEGWLLLGRTLAVMGRWADGVTALRAGLDPTGRDPELAAMLAEHMTFAAGGDVTAEARSLFAEVLSRRPEHPGARFYLALARYQAGDKAAALSAWSELAVGLPPETPWLPALRERINATAAELGMAPPAIASPTAPPPSAAPTAPPPSAAPTAAATEPGPKAADLQAAQQMSEGDRAQMIQGMVARLAERLRDNPDDLEGWRRLARAYTVLGERAKARDAFAEAARRAPGETALQADYANALVLAAADPEQVPAAAVEQYRRVLALDERHPAALWYLGLAAAQANDNATARAFWSRLLAVLPESSADAAAVRSSLDRLPAVR